MLPISQMSKAESVQKMMTLPPNSSERSARLLLAVCLTGVLGLVGQAAYAQVERSMYHRQQLLECAKYVSLGYPDSDKPTSARKSELGDCDAERLYYGLGQPADPVAARHCALGLSDDLEQEAGVLMMVYANGEGVPRNYALAKKAACAAKGAPLELAGRLAHLTDMEAGKRGSNPRIDICDDITSGFMQGICADIQSELARQARVKKLEVLTTGWNKAERRALATFQRKADQFFVDVSRLEVDQSGSARGAQALQAEFALQESLLESLLAFEQGHLPQYSTHEYALLDKELNHRYRLLRHKVEPSGTIRSEDVREAQHLWLAYREAFVAFGAQKYPKVPAHAWRAFATEERIRMLVELAESWD